MKQILLILNPSVTVGFSAYAEEYRGFIKDALDDETVELDIAHPDSLYMSVGDGQIRIVNTQAGKDLNQYSLIIIRGVGLHLIYDSVRVITVYAHEYHIPVINDVQPSHNPSKLAQAAHMHEQGFPVAETVLVNGAYLSHPEYARFDYPFILKAAYGAHGNQNYLVESRAQLGALLTENARVRFVAQRLIANDGDLRILIVGDKSIIIGRHAEQGSHLNNTSKGGQGVRVLAETLPDGLLEDAKKLAASLSMQLAGVDAIIDRLSGEYYFLEVNSQPQIMTGAFVDEKRVALGSFLQSLIN